MIAEITILSSVASASPENFEKVLADWIAAALQRVKRSPIRLPAQKKKIELQELEKELKSVEEQLDRIKAEMKDLQHHKRGLEKEIRFQKEALGISFIVAGEFETALDRGRYGIQSVLEDRIAEAIAVFPHLSQAISKENRLKYEKVSSF